MKTSHLVLILGLTVAAGAAAATLIRGEPSVAIPVAGDYSNGEIPRVVVTATREIPRVVVIGHRAAAPGRS